MADDSERAPDKPAPERLAELRRRIDAIDEDIHRLLRERAGVIDALIAAKGPSLNNGAFRPAREADMMHRLAARHAGSLPIATIEHLWREIIGTFTFLQAPYRAHVAGLAAPDGEMRDVARFTFGFAVPLVAAEDGAAAVAAVIDDPRDIALVRLAPTERRPWWLALSANGARVMARLPFFVVGGRAAATPALVVSAAVADEGPSEVACLAAVFPGGLDAALLADNGFELLSATSEPTPAALVARAGRPEAAMPILAAIGAADVRAVGGYAAPIFLTNDKERAR
jgi:chorismate mutase/prephenate dehydratase